MKPEKRLKMSPIEAMLILTELFHQAALECRQGARHFEKAREYREKGKELESKIKKALNRSPAKKKEKEGR